jgi:hypothetical protein
MEKSFVGDPVLWPGLVYSPLNNCGLLFALGAVASSVGLLFEEFAADSNTAICRRRSGNGWERLRVSFALRSSLYEGSSDDIDLLICWLDDASDLSGPPRLTVSRLLEMRSDSESMPPHRILESILPDTAAADLSDRARNRQTYEETIRQLDDQIKKIQNG